MKYFYALALFNKDGYNPFVKIIPEWEEPLYEVTVIKNVFAARYTFPFTITLAIREEESGYKRKVLIQSEHKPMSEKEMLEEVDKLIEQNK